MNKIKNVKLAELNINSVNVFFNTKIFQDDLIEYNKTYQQKFAKYLKERFLNFLTMITINLFDCCEKVFILINI